ncbi:hypothetical protein NM688_g3995 [Phlebia brevispora]|uniref:Uncharacterized protein n=1 Tax=Phlebia brevispora TaxID=194682 RepID=A0ACC1T4B9_9APHY|nr:hypothetical protein NM688_g3995 [Phlebia brevispora]
MSTAGSSNSAIIAAYEIGLIDNYCIYAALALAAYEHIVTFRHEYEFLCQRKWSAATWLLIVNRYTMLAAIIVQATPRSAQSAFPSPTVHDVVRVSDVISALFSAFRVFALLDRAYFATGCVLLLGIAQTAIILYEISRLVYWYANTVLGSSCYAYLSISDSVAFQRKNNVDDPNLQNKTLTTSVTVDLYGRLVGVILDMIALIVTWRRTYQHVRQAASIGIPTSLGASLLQYGILYFIVFSLTEIIPLVIDVIVRILIPYLESTDNGHWPLKPTTSEFTEAPGVFLAILPNILISRFLINLRQIDSLDANNTTESPSFSTTLRFHMPTLPEIIGNLGEPLATGDEVRDDEDQGFGEEFGASATELWNEGDEEMSSAPPSGYDGGEREEVRVAKRLNRTSRSLMHGPISDLQGCGLTVSLGGRAS